MTFGDAMEVLDDGAKAVGVVAVYLAVVGFGFMGVIWLIVKMVSTGGTPGVY